MGLHRHIKDPGDRYVPVEAVIQFFLSGSNRFPHIDTVYTHGNFQAIVMSASIDYNPDRSTKTEKDIFDSKFLAYDGTTLIRNKQPRLSEFGVCKVASQLLEAMVYLMDMNISHNDLSHHNYVLEKDLDVSSFASESSFCLLHLYRGIALSYMWLITVYSSLGATARFRSGKNGLKRSRFSRQNMDLDSLSGISNRPRTGR